MKREIELLKERYIKPLKKNPELLIGIELEFPIVNLTDSATDEMVCKDLLAYLGAKQEFSVEKRDVLGNPIQLIHKESQDQILFEVAYTTLEFAFSPVSSLQEVEERFEAYMRSIQPFLQARGHEIQGWGIHPQWQSNSNQPVQSPRYQMLMAYLDLAPQVNSSRLHDFPQYGAFICGSQVQLDVSHENYLQVLNAFNQIEAAKAYLFPNSTFSGADWDTKIARDRFWEESMHGFYQENCGLYPQDFRAEEDFLAYLDKTALFTAEREGETVYFFPILAKDYLQKESILAWNAAGEQKLIQPLEEDFQHHRAYHYQSLTTRGTVEFRSVCTQPLNRTFAPAAFHLGLLVNLEKLETYLQTAPFFEQYGRKYPALRRRFSRKYLSAEEEHAIRDFSQDLLSLAEEGLRQRGYGEEGYLE